PRLGHARRRRIARHRLEHRVVQGVDHHEGRDDAGGLGGVEPRRGQRDGGAPDHFAGRGLRGGPGPVPSGPRGFRGAPRGRAARRWAKHHERDDKQRREEASNTSHGSLPLFLFIGYRLLSFTSSYGAENAYPAMIPMPDSSTFGPSPLRPAFSQIGAIIVL